VRAILAFGLGTLLCAASCELDFDRFEPTAGGVQGTSGDGSFADVGAGGVDAPAGDGPISRADGAGLDGVTNRTDASAPDAPSSSDADAGSIDVASDADSLSVGLVALYLFDETGGTSAADSSGNGYTASLVGGATFSSGLQNNALTLSGNGQYVSLPAGVLNGLTSFSVSTWINQSASPVWARVFDFGTGTTAYMFLTPNSGNTLRFSITTMGFNREQQVNAPMVATGSWQQVALTLSGNTGVLYANGVEVGRTTNMTLNPSSIAPTTQQWIGRSEFAPDPYFAGQIDNFRIYSRALSAAEVQARFAARR
jgi:hypothetical protein